MRIAMLADFYPPYNRGGAGVVAHRLAKYFARQGHEILVVTTVQEEVLQKEYEIDGVAVIAIPVNYPERFRNFLGVNNPSAVASVRSCLAEFKPDLVHAHNIHHYLSLACIRASDHMGWPTVVTSHDYLFVCCGRLTCTTGPQCFRPNIVSCAMTQRLRFNPFRNAAARKIINSHSSYVLAISDVMRRALEINGIERVETIHNGIDVDEWVPQYLDMNTEIRPKVTLPGRISDEKGAEVLLKAVAEVPITGIPKDIASILPRLNGSGYIDGVVTICALIKVSLTASELNHPVISRQPLNPTDSANARSLVS